MHILAVFRPSPTDPVFLDWDIIEEIVEYDPYRRGSSEVVFRDANGLEHRTSTAYIRLYPIGTYRDITRLLERY